MTDRAVEGKACNGDVCINGYARMKGYWQDSKGGLSTYTFVKDKIWTGAYSGGYPFSISGDIRSVPS